MTPSEQLAGKVRRRVRRLGHRSWHGRQPGVSVETGGHCDGAPVVTVTTRDVDRSDVDELRRSLVDDPPAGYVAVTVGPAHQDGHMVESGVGRWWFSVSAVLPDRCSRCGR